MKKQDILNAFREEIAPYLLRRMDGLETAKSWDLEKVEQFILNTLKEFEREVVKEMRKPKSMSKTFDEFLKEVHGRDYHGTDDDMPDDFEHWFGHLEIEDICEYADEAIEDTEREMIEEKIDTVDTIMLYVRGLPIEDDYKKSFGKLADRLVGKDREKLFNTKEGDGGK